MMGWNSIGGASHGGTRRSRHASRRGLLGLGAGLVAAWLCAASAAAQSAEILFVRGAERSGNLGGGSDNILTRQLADIESTSTTGWNELRETLETEGFSVSQIIEPLEPGAPPTGPTEGAPIAFQSMDLSVYDVLVFGSNNAVYDDAAIDAVEAFIRGGGGAIFISDAGFGSDWADAANSDQQFLDRFGLIMHQDRGIYSIERALGDFLIPDHPVLAGVDAFDGEGVSPVEVGEPTAGVEVTVLALAKNTTRLNEPPFDSDNKGPSRPSGPDDAALLLASADAGCIVGFYDRNTFFNTGGLGTDLTNFDNRQLAINVFKAAAGLLPCDDDAPDADDDGVPDESDNCTDVPNPSQVDFDAGTDDDSSLAGIQHYGDACDVDLDDDGIVGPSDFFSVFRPCLGADLGSIPSCVEADLDGDGIVAPADFFGAFRPALGSTPGPGVTEP